MSALRLPANLLTLVAAVCALLVVGSPTALAHDGLVSTSPAAGATVTGAQASVGLTFSSEPLPLGSAVSVTGPSGPVAEGSTDIRGTTVVQRLDADLVPGAYRVEWRSTSSDGHPLSGAFDFAVAPDGAPSEVALDATARATGSGSPVIWAVAGAVVLGGLGAVAVSRSRRRG